MKLFISQTIDGFIAGEGDNLDHLHAFQGNDYGYDPFVASVGAVIVGRRTFDRIFPDHGWTYPPHAAGVVMTSRPLPEGLPAQVSACSSVEAAARQWPDAFIDGGAETIAQFLRIGAVRSAQIFTLPVRIGRGVRLFPHGEPVESRWRLRSVTSFPCGTIRADYDIANV